MIDDTPLPLLLADYRGFKLDKADDLEDIVREICPNEAEIDVMARHQQRFLELVANQYPPGDEVRDLICPVCASRNLNAMVRLEPLFDERLCVVRCADCGWEQQAKGDCPWVQIRPFKADLGAATATGFLLVADPVADSIVRGTLLVLGRENITFAARGDEPFEVAVLGVTIVIKFDAASQAFSGSAQQEGTAPQAPTIMVGLG